MRKREMETKRKRGGDKRKEKGRKRDEEKEGKKCGRKRGRQSEREKERKRERDIEIFKKLARVFKYFFGQKIFGVSVGTTKLPA